MNSKWLVWLWIPLFAGCAYTPEVARLPPGQASEADVIAAAGTPFRRWPNPDGGATLEYSTQPFGISCLMVTLDAGGRLVSVREALSGEGLARVRSGMTREEVARLLGAERSVEFFSLSGEEVWDWNVDNSTGPGVATRFNVHFRDGRVLRTSQTYVFPADGDLGIDK